MTIQPIDPALLSLLCRLCSDAREEWLSFDEIKIVLHAGLATHESHCGLTSEGAALLVRALRLSELRGKWLEAQIAERNTYDNLGVFGRKPWEAARKAEKEAREAYKAAGGAL